MARSGHGQSLTLGEYGSLCALRGCVVMGERTRTTVALGIGVFAAAVVSAKVLRIVLSVDFPVLIAPYAIAFILFMVGAVAIARGDKNT